MLNEKSKTALAALAVLCTGVVLYFLISIYADSGKSPLPEETTRLIKLVNKSPANVEYRHRLGALYLHQGDFKNAEKEFLYALNLAPKNTDVLQSIGMLYYRKGERHKAIRYWRTLLEIEPDNRIIWDIVNRLSMADANKGIPHDSADINSEWELNYRLGQESYQNRDYKKAVSHFQKALDMNPSDFRTHFNLGATYYEMKDMKSAKKSWETALKYNKEDFMTMKLINLADKGIDRLKWMDDLRAQIKKDPGNWKPHYDLGEAYLKDMDTFGEAEKEFLKVLQIDSGNAQAYSKLIGLNVQMDDYEKAIKYAKLFSEKKPGEAETKQRLYALLAYKKIIENSRNRWEKSGLEAYDEMAQIKNSKTVFDMDKYEVTRAQYQKFLKSTGHQQPPDWKDSSVKGKENHPVTNVTWYDAIVYCKWKGKRLPTEEEWKGAAWGDVKSRYPWGDEFDLNKACLAESGFDKAAPSGSYPHQNGVHDMIGNVMEWTSSGDNNRRIKKGGAFNTSYLDISSSSKWEAPPEQSDNATGFRCLKDGGTY